MLLCCGGDRDGTLRSGSVAGVMLNTGVVAMGLDGNISEVEEGEAGVDHTGLVAVGGSAGTLISWLLSEPSAGAMLLPPSRRGARSEP